MNNLLGLKEYKIKDTIAAIATFPSTSALGIIKLSGKKSLSIVEKIFVPANKKTKLKKALTHTVHYGWIADKKNLIDEVIVTLMRSPKTYTRQDVVEISCHGGTFVLNKILELLISRGARLALPGEFTYRALVSGRIDLIQAQSVLDVIGAKSKDSLVSAVSQLQGKTSQDLIAIKNQLTDIYAKTEALVSFPEDDIEFCAIAIIRDLAALKLKLTKLAGIACQTRVMKEGLRCVICGRANAGKSTLFNRLLNQERVIVSSVAGTTRDVVEETIYLAGVPLRIYDTAGILEPKDLVTKKALEKTNQAFKQADLIIVVIDGSKKLSDDDWFFLNRGQDKQVIVVLNKADKKQLIAPDDLTKVLGKKICLSLAKDPDIKELEKAISQLVFKHGVSRQDMIFLSHYQQDILGKTIEYLDLAGQYLKDQKTADLANAAIKNGLMELGKLTGEVFCQQVIQDIFSKFCIGK